MANIFNNFVQQVVTGDTMKDRTHASKLFVANNYALVPKFGFLYHVFIDINTAIPRYNGMENTIKQTEAGMLVKQVSLPKFSLDTKSLNAYNRPHVIQTKIHYDPVTIQFHDDSSDVVRNFWFDYYSYYYRNSDNGGSGNLAAMKAVHDEIFSPRQQKDWGYGIRQYETRPYLNAIRIYSLHAKRFSEYVLVNPIIKSFQHGDHNSSDGTALLGHTMTVEYETVFYAYGSVGAPDPMGFGDLHYDKTPSPLTPAGGGTRSILGPGGLLESASEVTQDLANGNIGAALFKGARVGSTLKGANLKSMVATEAVQLLKNVLASGPGPQANAFGTAQILQFKGKPGQSTLPSPSEAQALADGTLPL